MSKTHLYDDNNASLQTYIDTNKSIFGIYEERVSIVATALVAPFKSEMISLSISIFGGSGEGLKDLTLYIIS